MTSTVAALIWFIVALIPLALGALAVLEGCLFLTGRAPVTTYVRNWSNGHALFSLALGIVFLVGSAIGITHFWLDR